MREEIKQAWLAALRSGEYMQGRSALRQGTAMCCLGVLCELHAQMTGEDGWSPAMLGGEFRGYYNDKTGLPLPVREWAGIEGRYPKINSTDITYYNDGAEGDDEDFPTIRPRSFAEIADLIEAHL